MLPKRTESSQLEFKFVEGNPITGTITDIKLKQVEDFNDKSKMVDRLIFSISFPKVKGTFDYFTGQVIGNKKAKLTLLYKALFPSLSLSEWLEIDTDTLIGKKIGCVFSEGDSGEAVLSSFYNVEK